MLFSNWYEEAVMVAFIGIGVPYFIGQFHPERTEIDKIKASGILAEIDADWVDIQLDESAADPVLAVNQQLAQVIAAHPDRVPLIFAADCVSALGALKGLAAQRPQVLWYDAHGDFNTPQTTPSGFLGGMPLAMLVGRGDLQYMQGLGLEPVPEDHVTITDARDLDPEEGEALRASRLRHLPHVSDLLAAPLPDGPLYIHMDTDVVDPAEMPGMSYAAPGGPSAAQVNQTLERVTRECQIAGVLFSLWNDSLTTDNRSLQHTLSMVRTVVGHD
jgi:arginase